MRPGRTSDPAAPHLRTKPPEPARVGPLAGYAAAPPEVAPHREFSTTSGPNGTVSSTPPPPSSRRASPTPPGATGMGSLRIQDTYRVDPNDLGSLPAGVAWVVTGGRAKRRSLERARVRHRRQRGGGISSCLPRPPPSPSRPTVLPATQPRQRFPRPHRSPMPWARGSTSRPTGRPGTPRSVPPTPKGSDRRQSSGGGEPLTLRRSQAGQINS